MSRSKKSRKPGGAPTAKPKLSKQELEKVEKRIRKSTGKVAGNRQKEAMPVQADSNNNNANKDPRLGNKTPIVLGKLITKEEKAKAEKLKQSKAKQNSEKLAAIASVRFVENNDVEPPLTQDISSNQALTPEQELDAIEQDEMLQSILAKQEDDVALTEQDVNYYNDMMERHQVLSAELGLDEEDDSIDSDEASHSDSEDDLWDKLDRPGFSDFEDKE